jgi:hypothetical protein
MGDWTREYFERGYAQRWGLPAPSDVVTDDVDRRRAARRRPTFWLKPQATLTPSGATAGSGERAPAGVDGNGAGIPPSRTVSFREISCSCRPGRGEPSSVI